MTRFLKHGDVQDTLMLKRTIIRKPSGEIIVDPHKAKFLNDAWMNKIRKPNGDINYDFYTPLLTPYTSKIVVQYLLDMKIGKNTAKGTKRGPRSESTIKHMRTRLPSLIELINNYTNKKFPNYTEDDILLVFGAMRDGTILTKNDAPFKDTGTYVRSFAKFWRYYMRIKKKEGIILEDICSSVETGRDIKPKWNYITYEQAQRMSYLAPSPYYKALVMFLFDSGIRAPTELMNVRVKDLTPIPDSNNLFLQIRHETSKTFGRKIKLMLSSEAIKIYLEISGKKEEDMLFDYSYESMNKMIKKLGYLVLNVGNIRKDKHGVTRYYDGISMYDFRHSSVCYYLPIYKSENQMKYRYGWKNSKMIHYYSEFIGMTDNITEDQLQEPTKNQEAVIQEPKQEKITKQQALELIQKLQEILNG
jgi:hypothetical protein